MNRPDPSSSDDDTPDKTIGEPILRGENLTKEFGNLVALDGVDFALSRNEILGLIGPNGAGKTTMFNCISGVYAPTTGSVSLFGEEVTGNPQHVIASMGMTRTFQTARPLEELTVLENVMLGAYIDTRSRSTAREIATHQLEFVGLADVADVEADELTIADQKTMELARVLATDPEVLLIDEIMAGLTPTETEHMLGLVREVRASGKSLIVIEHDMKAIMDISDRVMVLNNGVKIADDVPEVVANDDQVIESYIGGNHA